MGKKEKIEREMLIDAINNKMKFIYDPEIPVSIYDLGMIYEVDVDELRHAKVVMTLTAPNCPVAESLPEQVKESVLAVPGIKSATVEVTFDPPWSQDMMSEEAKLELGFL